MSLADVLANESLPNPQATPRVEGDRNGGAAVAPAVEDGAQADYDHLLEAVGLDPQLYEVIEPVRFNRWQGYDGRWMRQDKFSYRRRDPARDADVAALVKQIGKHRSKRPEAPPKTRTALCVNLADWQVGKSEGGGSEALVARVLDLIDTVAGILRDEKPDLLVVAGLGDLVEGCSGHYFSQTWSADLDRRSQVKVVRRLLIKALTTWAPLAPRVEVACVPGNHGENRKNGKAYTGLADNDDVAVFEQVADVLAANPEVYGHVRFAIPDAELVVTLDVCGTIIAFAHGHQFRNGTSIIKKAFNWWMGQSLGGHAAREADVLVSGHYHHLLVAHRYGKVWMQCPSLDGGSKWFTDTTGEHDAPGTLVFTVTEEGVDHVRIV